MSEEFDDQEVLEAARRALSPTAADAERVLNATRGAIASAAAAGAFATVAGSSHAARAATFGTATRTSGWRLALSALSIAAVSGGVGYYAGSRVPHEVVPGASLAATTVPHVPASVSASDPVSVSDPVSDSDSDSVPVPVPDPVSDSDSVPVSDSAPDSDSVSHRAPDVAAPPTAPRVAKRSPALSTETPPADEPLAFSTQEEITAMRRIERALREHEPQRALTLLFELDRNVPDGKLMQERQAAFAMARCAAGLGSAPQLVAEFAARYRNSAYLARVRQMCAVRDSAAQQPLSPAPQ